MMKEMARRMQVISISHCPRLPRREITTLRYIKKTIRWGTISRIRRLTDEERVAEIAGMISGSVVSDAALENARLLLGQF